MPTLLLRLRGGPRCWAATVCGAAILGFTILAIAVAAGGPDGWDAQGNRWALAHRGGSVAAIAGAVTRSAQYGYTLPVVVGAGLLATCGSMWRRVRTAALLGAALSVGLMIRLALSDLVGRSRPAEVDWITPAGGYAFPSGHATAAALAAGLVAWTVSRRVRTRSRRLSSWLAAVLYAGVVGWSRVWLGVHWPSDVVGSWLFATGWLTGAWLIVTHNGVASIGCSSGGAADVPEQRADGEHGDPGQNSGGRQGGRQE